MKRVTLLDNAGGNAQGWNPTGGLADFTITEPAVVSKDTSFVTIWVSQQTPVCRVYDQDVSGFIVRCDPAPTDGAELQYVIENLPAHVSEP